MHGYRVLGTCHTVGERQRLETEDRGWETGPAG